MSSEQTISLAHRLPVASHRRLVAFRAVAALTGALLLLAAVSYLLAPWSVPADTGDPHAGAHRWFMAVAGAADMIGAISMLALAFRPKLTLLAVNTLFGVIVAALLNLPVDLWFGVILLILSPMLLLYPYWSALGGLRAWWSHPVRPLLWLGLVTTAVVIGIGAVSFVRQFTVDDDAAHANWWADYAEHVCLLGVVLLFAATRRPGWQILTAAASAAWIYLGLVAVFVLPDQTASWGPAGGLIGCAVGIATASMLLLPSRPDPVATETR